VSNQPYKVLLTDAERFPPSEEDMKTLSAIGAELVGIPYGAKEEELVEICKDIDAVLVFAAKITARVIENMQRCRIIARCGIGYDNIDIGAAADRRIPVTFVPDYCIEEVSDHTIGLMIDCLRKISFSNERVKRRYWDNYEQLGTMRRIAGQTVGLVGFGRIAQAIARKLSGFNMRIVACDPFVDPAVMEAMGVARVDFDELIRSANVVSLHLPLTPATRHCLNEKVFKQMKRGTIVINTSRGALIDERALIDSILSGHIAAAGLDVLETEPPDLENELVKLPQVVVTPHSAAYTEEALAENKQKAIAEIVRCFKGQALKNLVPGSVKHA